MYGVSTNYLCHVQRKGGTPRKVRNSIDKIERPCFCLSKRLRSTYQAYEIPRLSLFSGTTSELVTNKKVPTRYAHIIDACDMLSRGLQRLGIIGLVDEATGFQASRDREALQEMLDRFLRHELAAWAKRFPDEFYEHIFRLRGWKWHGRSKNPPQVVAAYTQDIVYARLAPQILDELEKRNPIEGGRRKGAHHQLLTEDVGHPALAQHLHAVVTLMRVSKTWTQFKLMLDIAHPKRGDTLQLPLMAETAMRMNRNQSRCRAHRQTCSGIRNDRGRQLRRPYKATPPV